MVSTFQTPEQNMLQHGESVLAWYKDIIGFFRGGDLQNAWRLPTWVQDASMRRSLVDRLMPLPVVTEYILWHDCGKPLCREIGPDGRQRFPGHAAMSEKTWLAVGGSEQAAKLMGMDMDVHLLRAEGVEEFASRPEAATLLLVGLCEIHSNAGLFGGIESVSFKIKWKQLEKRGRAVIASWSIDEDRV